MILHIVQISIWVMVFCCLPERHFIFPLSTLNKRWFSKGSSTHLHCLSSSPNINFILCLHGKKKKKQFPLWCDEKESKDFQMIQIKNGYNYMSFFISGQFLPKPKLVLWPFKSASLLPTPFTFNHPRWASFIEPPRNVCCAVNSADWDRSYSFCSNGKFISVTGVPCHQSVPRTHIDINGSFVCIVQVGYHHHYLLTAIEVPDRDH